MDIRGPLRHPVFAPKSETGFPFRHDGTKCRDNHCEISTNFSAWMMKTAFDQCPPASSKWIGVACEGQGLGERRELAMFNKYTYTGTHPDALRGCPVASDPSTMRKQISNLRSIHSLALCARTNHRPTQSQSAAFHDSQNSSFATRPDRRALTRRRRRQPQPTRNPTSCFLPLMT